MAVSDATVLIMNISMSHDSIQQTAQRPKEWQAVQLAGLPQRHLLWKRWYALRHHISRPSSLVIRALIATTRCKQHVILFVSRAVLFFNFFLLTSNLGIERDLGEQAFMSYQGGILVRRENRGVECVDLCVCMCWLFIVWVRAQFPHHSCSSL